MSKDKSVGEKKKPRPFRTCPGSTQRTGKGGEKGGAAPLVKGNLVAWYIRNNNEDRKGNERLPGALGDHA